ncbi:trans-sialidase [Trypanosoma cruzi]|nr:trans-sialidase [Trypanosoma cruzi]
MNEERQYATSSSPQSQHSPAQPLGNKNGPAASVQTSSADAIGPSTSGGTGEVKGEEPSSGGMVPALSPALSAGSRPLPTRSPATNRTLALNGTRMLTLPWARTAAPIHSAPPTRRPRMAPQESLSPAKTQELFNATTVCWTALAPHRLIRAQRLRSPRSHRSPTQRRPWAMTFLIWRMSPSWCPWV